MKKALTKTIGIYHYKNGVRVEGAPEDITGNISDIRGDLSGISGNISGITGNISGISGDLDDCEITEEERKAGISVDMLVI